MKPILLFTLLAILFVASSVLAQDDLTSKNFDEKVASKEFALIEFFAPWCGHCKKLAPEYATLAEKFANNEKVSIFKVNGDDESDLMTKYQIQGFPTLKLFKNGKFFRDYDGDRTAEAIAQWLNKKTGPVAVPIDSESALQELKSSSKVLVVGFVSSKDSDNYKNLLEAADNSDLEDFIVAVVVGNADLNAKNQITQDSVVVFRDFDSTPAVSANFDVQAIVDFVKENGYPLVDEVSGATFQRLVEKELPIGVLFIDFADESAKKKYIEELTEIAQQFKGKVVLGYSDASIYGEQLSIMGGNKNIIPGFAIMDVVNRANYPLKAESITKEDIANFVGEVLAGKVPKFVRSQEIPAENNEPVKIVVGKSFDDIVINNDNDVLLEFYAPWCGHCKSLEPVYNQLAEELKDVKGLTIAKIDATENDTPINIEGFPTIYFFPKGGKQSPVPYEGDRTKDDLKNFLKTNAVGAVFSEKKDEL
ncbi:hypothetical protein C9374_003068 [Naegleria lovaniensis]|uniref:Protein disulfide-isomerase n=1 Tax=Naegleria lovaniensis TaxID=51637 RepID=A0AA88GTM6_NAELO|nr:uncharacterized protein C9374_003068 [Naegleria lovaniensis]KAG2385919.1 hypothetical protein C9374_003068 [Naegleria lovaniensis]